MRAAPGRQAQGMLPAGGHRKAGVGGTERAGIHCLASASGGVLGSPRFPPGRQQRDSCTQALALRLAPRAPPPLTPRGWFWLRAAGGAHV